MSLALSVCQRRRRVGHYANVRTGRGTWHIAEPDREGKTSSLRRLAAWLERTLYLWRYQCVLDDTTSPQSLHMQEPFSSLIT